jgi:alkanesulfonate monooxygenase SsuD/methylene tetrahydromethanopterin reductase-like flavin-dependent oxidoreductase (luciferase family)
MDRFEEGVEVTIGLLSNESYSFTGRHYSLTDARNEPKGPQRPHPPIVIGGGGEKRTLRTAARFAQHWNFPGGAPADFARKRTILHEHCATVGRDPCEIVTSTHLLLWERHTIDDVVAQAEGFAAAGCDVGIVYVEPPFSPSTVDALERALQSLR